MNKAEEGEYGWTTQMDEYARIEDVLTLWNKDVDTLFIFVRDYHVDISLSNRFSSLTSSPTDMLVLCGPHSVRTFVIYPTSYISSGLCSQLPPPRELQPSSVLRVRLLF